MTYICRNGTVFVDISPRSMSGDVPTRIRTVKLLRVTRGSQKKAGAAIAAPALPPPRNA